jgi:hypothetical protein
LASSIEISHPTYQAWVSAINATTGGINEHKINLMFKDDQNGKFTTPYGTDPSCSPDQA